MKDLGPISPFLGIQIFKSSNDYFLHQDIYTKDLLKASRLLDYKPTITIIPVNPPLNTSFKQPFNNLIHYKQLASSLQHLTVNRLNII